MSNDKSLVPTGPGWWYHTEHVIVEVVGGDWSLYYRTGHGNSYQVADDSLWRGPVPMPGEWVAKSEYDELLRNLEDRI